MKQPNALFMKITLANVAALTLLATSASAQLVPDGGTAIIDGVTNTLTSRLTVGTNVGNTTLILTNAGRVNSDGGTIGSEVSSSNNVVVITGPGSTWNNYSNTIVTLGDRRIGQSIDRHQWRQVRWAHLVWHVCHE